MGATEKIAQFVLKTSFEGIPRDAIEKAKRTALDCIGAALAGVGERTNSVTEAFEVCAATDAL